MSFRAEFFRVRSFFLFRTLFIQSACRTEFELVARALGWVHALRSGKNAVPCDANIIARSLSRKTISYTRWAAIAISWKPAKKRTCPNGACPCQTDGYFWISSDVVTLPDPVREIHSAYVLHILTYIHLYQNASKATLSRQLPDIKTTVHHDLQRLFGLSPEK